MTEKTDAELADEIQGRVPKWVVDKHGSWQETFTSAQWRQIIAALRRQHESNIRRANESLNGPERPPSSDQVLVPREPTPEMLDRGRQTQSMGDEEIARDDMRLKWQAMLAACEEKK